MNINYLVSQLQQAGWKNIGPNIHVSIEFDLIGSRSFMLTKWHILIKSLPVLDSKMSAVWQDNFKVISNKSKSWLWGKCFLLCLIAQQVSADTLDAMKSDQFGLFGVIRLKGGGGRVLIADEMNRQVYGEIPPLPYDAHKFTTSVKEILVNGFLQK